MKPRSANKADLFVDEHHCIKLDTLDNLLAEIDLAALATEIDVIAPRLESPHGGRPLSSAETRGRILASNLSYNRPGRAVGVSVA